MSHHNNQQSNMFNPSVSDLGKNYSNIKNTKSNSNINTKSNYNALVITALTALYILLIFKLASILASSYEDEEQTKTFVMVVYILSIMGLVIGFVWLKSNSNGNYVIKRSLTIGGILSLFYTIITYWEYLDDYSKLVMIAFSIGCIIYYVY